MPPRSNSKLSGIPFAQFSFFFRGQGRYLFEAEGLHVLTFPTYRVGTYKVGVYTGLGP